MLLWSDRTILYLCDYEWQRVPSAPFRSMVVELGRIFETFSEVVLIKCKNSMFLQGCSSELVMHFHKFGGLLRDRFEYKMSKSKQQGQRYPDF